MLRRHRETTLFPLEQTSGKPAVTAQQMWRPRDHLPANLHPAAATAPAGRAAGTGGVRAGGGRGADGL